MAVISTGSFAKALKPGINKFWGANYNDHELECNMVFDVASSDRNYEEDVEVPGYGLAAVKAEGNPISYDGHTQGPTTRYTHITYGSGFIVTREELEDNVYRDRAFQRTARLARSMRQTKENIAVNVFDNGFTTNGADGAPMLATTHPTSAGGTQQNELTTAADLSEASLEDLLILVMNAKDTKGLRIALQARKLIVPPNEAFNAERIVKSSLQSGTANNDLNAVKNMGLLPEGVMVWHYLADPDSWYIKSDLKDSLRLFNRREAEIAQDGDFDTENLKYKSTMRFSVGFSDWRGIWGSPGI